MKVKDEDKDRWRNKAGESENWKRGATNGNQDSGSAWELEHYRNWPELTTRQKCSTQNWTAPPVDFWLEQWGPFLHPHPHQPPPFVPLFGQEFECISGMPFWDTNHIQPRSVCCSVFIFKHPIPSSAPCHHIFTSIASKISTTVHLEMWLVFPFFLLIMVVQLCPWSWCLWSYIDIFLGAATWITMSPR